MQQKNQQPKLSDATTITNNDNDDDNCDVATTTDDDDSSAPSSIHIAKSRYDYHNPNDDAINFFATTKSLNNKNDIKKKRNEKKNSHPNTIDVATTATKTSTSDNANNA